MDSPINTVLKPISYPPKILIAWKEAIGGNRKIRDWLTNNGYKELGIFCFALSNDDKAKNWLFDNGYAHLLALINGAEGNELALGWLKNGGFTILYHMARAADSYEDSKDWIMKNDKLFAAIALQMEIIKDDIDDKYNDPHQINP
jgi:hypothetical protein